MRYDTMTHFTYNEGCPLNDPETMAHPMTRGLPCTCKTLPADVRALFLRAHAWRLRESASLAEAEASRVIVESWRIEGGL